MSRVAHLISRDTRDIADTLDTRDIADTLDGEGRPPRPPFPRCLDGLMYVESPIFDILGALQHTHTHTIARAHASTKAWGGEHECERD